MTTTKSSVETIEATESLVRAAGILASCRSKSSSNSSVLTIAVFSALGRACSEKKGRGVNWVNVELVRAALFNLSNGALVFPEAIERINSVGAKDPGETFESVWPPVGG